jgi:hypothetical protein
MPVTIPINRRTSSESALHDIVCRERISCTLPCPRAVPIEQVEDTSVEARALADFAREKSCQGSRINSARPLRLWGIFWAAGKHRIAVSRLQKQSARGSRGAKSNDQEGVKR